MFKGNRSIIPPGFQCGIQDLSLSEYQPLAESGCTCFCPVKSPAGWEVMRTGNFEPNHLDLFFIGSGSILFECGGNSIRAHAGEVLIVQSWLDRRLYQDEYSDHVYFRFNNPEFYSQIVESTSRPCAALQQILFCAEMLCRNNGNLPDEKLYRTHLAQVLHILLQRELHCAQNDRAVIQTWKLQRLLNAIDRRDYNTEHIAREFGMCISTFRKFCLENFALPPHAVVEKARMNRARAMLDYSLFSIEEIAESLGYADRFSFSKAFRRTFQISPVAFRKRYNSESGTQGK